MKKKKRRKRSKTLKRHHFLKRHAPTIIALGLWLVPSPLA